MNAAEAPVRPGCLGYLLFAWASLWSLLLTFGIQGLAWGAGQLMLIQEEPPPAYFWPAVSWANGLLLLLPLAPLAFLTRAPRLRAVYQSWTLAALFMLVLGFVRFIPETRTEAILVGQILLGLACVPILIRLVRRRGYSLDLHPPALIPAMAVAPVAVAPWLAFGALGSPLDTVLSVLAGLSLGLFSGVVVAAFLGRPPAPVSQRPGRDIVFGGFAVGVALAILGGGFGFAGSQLLLLAALPPLGFAVVAVGRFGRRREAPDGGDWLPAAALIGLAAAAPLAFFDPEEITLLLGEGDVPTWAARAAGLAILLALAVGIVLWAVRHSVPLQRRPDLWIPPFVGAWAGVLLVYLLVGQPGFHGEQLFVILRDQADLSPAYSIADRAERTSYVYQTLARHAESSQAGLRAALDRFHVAYRPYYLVNGLEVDGGPLARLYLSWQPEVDRVLDSPHLRPLPEPKSPGTGRKSAPTEPQWNLTSMGVDRVWRELGVTGAGIVVGQSDSGAEGGHPALRDGYRGRVGGDDYNWLDPWNGTASPTDPDGHGTVTLGLAVGKGNVGVAPDAEWFGCANLARNLGNPAYYLNCMQFMLAPYPQKGDPFRDGDPGRAAHVANNSWGCPDIEGCDTGALAPAAAALRAAGIFVAASAGNSGPRCGSVQDPIAIYPSVLSVGAVDEAGNVAEFSSRGPVTVDGSGRIKPDLVAPGVDVLSSYPGNSYETGEGTSVAGPHVAGVVALMWSAQPKLIGDIDRTERILIETARPYEGLREGCFVGETPNSAYGYGLVDAYAAVKAALALQ